jgi:hypothetical protein
MAIIKNISMYFQDLKVKDEKSKKANQKYFTALFEQFKNDESKDLVLHCPEQGIESNVYPLAILNDQELPQIQDYENLVAAKPELLKSVTLVMCKMHAGLGSSVERSAVLKSITGRSKLGSKGTDLFIKRGEAEYVSLAELQLVQAQKITEASIYREVKTQNLVNFETEIEVGKIKSKYPNLVFKPELTQLMLPTINEDSELTDERTAPAGHGFVGHAILMDIFKNPMAQEIISIGNGEDLNSTIDEKTASWIIENEIPITMITTTKLAKDKKGGQISKVVTAQGHEYMTIVEKAQAEKAGQLAYFEELGLRQEDNRSLFNTNIVLINTKALKEKVLKHFKLDADEFSKIIIPDLIKNTKSQDGKVFTQLEGALGSAVLNLDKYARLNYQQPLIHFLNLDPVSREKFFIPIKKYADFSDLQERYVYNEDSGRFELKK